MYLEAGPGSGIQHLNKGRFNSNRQVVKIVLTVECKMEDGQHYRPSVLQPTFDLPVEVGKSRDEFVFSHKDKERWMQTTAEKRGKKSKNI